MLHEFKRLEPQTLPFAKHARWKRFFNCYSILIIEKDESNSFGSCMMEIINADFSYSKSK